MRKCDRSKQILKSILGKDYLDSPEIEQMLTTRTYLRKEGRYKEADSLRQKVEKARVIIKDNRSYTSWRFDDDRYFYCSDGHGIIEN